MHIFTYPLKCFLTNACFTSRRDFLISINSSFGRRWYWKRVTLCSSPRLHLITLCLELSWLIIDLIVIHSLGHICVISLWYTCISLWYSRNICSDILIDISRWSNGNPTIANIISRFERRSHNCICVIIELTRRLLWPWIFQKKTLRIVEHGYRTLRWHWPWFTFFEAILRLKSQKTKLC